MSTPTMEQMLTKKLAAEVAKEIDLKKLAKQLAPTMAKTIQKSLLEEVKSFRYDAVMYESLGKTGFKEIERAFIRALKKLK